MKIKHFCEPCGDNGKKLLAAGFCVDCSECLCRECYKHHCTPRPSRNHVLQDISSMPKTKPDSRPPKTQDAENKCQKHKGEPIKFYCRSDSKFGCGSCMAIDHYGCDKPIHIEDEYESFEAKVNQFNEQLKYHSEKREQNSTADKNNHNVVVKDIKRFVTEVKEHFQNIEPAMITEADKVQDDNEQKMKAISDTCKTLRNDLQTLTTVFSVLHQTQQNEKLFTMMEETSDQMETIAKNIDQMNRENTLQSYSFEPDKQMQDMISKVSAIGKLVIEHNYEHQNDKLDTSEEDNLNSDKAMASNSKAPTQTDARQKQSSKTYSPISSTVLRQEEPTRSKDTQATEIPTSTAPTIKRGKQTDVKTTRAIKKTNLEETSRSENTQATEIKTSTAPKKKRKDQTDVKTTRAITRQVSQELDSNVKFTTFKAEPSLVIKKTKLEEISRSENTQATGIKTSTAPKKKRKDQTDVKTTYYNIKRPKQDKRETKDNSLASGSSNKDTAGNVQQFPFIPRQVSQVLDINVKSPTVKADPSATGLALLPGDKLILADYKNLKAKLINTKENRIITELKLPSKPYDITVVSDNQVAMTMPKANQIQLMSVSNNEILLGQIIKVKGQCCGIVHNNGTFLVTFEKPAKVEMISMSGSVLKVIDIGTNGEPLFVWPRDIALSPDNTLVYVSDMGKHRHNVTCMTLDGEVKGEYRDGHLRNPRGLTVDKTGSVYVVDETFGKKYIYQLSADCSQGQEVLGVGQDLSWPISITYCHKEDKLYVGQPDSCSIKVFQLN